MNAKSGSATVEAALLYPLVILLLAFIMQKSIALHSDIKETSIQHVSTLVESMEAATEHPSLLLRSRLLQRQE